MKRMTKQTPYPGLFRIQQKSISLFVDPQAPFEFRIDVEDGSDQSSSDQTLVSVLERRKNELIEISRRYFTSKKKSSSISYLIFIFKRRFLSKIESPSDSNQSTSSELRARNIQKPSDPNWRVYWFQLFPDSIFCVCLNPRFNVHLWTCLNVSMCLFTLKWGLCLFSVCPVESIDIGSKSVLFNLWRFELLSVKKIPMTASSRFAASVMWNYF